MQKCNGHTIANFACMPKILDLNDDTEAGRVGVLSSDEKLGVGLHGNEARVYVQSTLLICSNYVWCGV